MAAQEQDTIVTQNVRVQFISINYLYFAKLLASLCALVFWYKAVTAKYSVTQERKENQSRKKFSWRYKVIEIAFTQGSSYLCNSCISAQNQHWGFSWCRNRVRRQECKTPSLQRMCLLSLDLGVAVSREKQGCVLGWWETANFQGQHLFPWETAKGWAETMLWSPGSGSPEGYQCFGEGSSCSLC